MNIFKIRAKTSSEKEKEILPSGTIQWSQAKTMIQKYWQNPNALHISVPVEEGSSVEELKRLDGFRILKTDVLDIFSNQNVTELFIMFAVESGDIAKPIEQQDFTTILVGLDNTNNIVTSKAIDFCDPCPNKCPINKVSAVTV